MPKLSGKAELIGSPSLAAGGIDANKTIANFWGQATTLFDYIRRAMPWPTPHTLSDDEVYALCAYLLAGNEIIPQDESMNAQTLPKVKMPNRNNFIIKFRIGFRPGKPLAGLVLSRLR